MQKIILNNVSKIIKGRTVLSDINIKLEGGTIYGLSGINGSGKTMLLRMIAGLIKPTTGAVFINEKELHKDMDFPEDVGALIENPDFWPSYTGEEALYSIAKIKKQIGIPEIQKTLEYVGLKPNDSRTIKKYSLGMKKRLGIAQAIMENPKILLLDEPCNALDAEGEKMVSQLLQKKKEEGAIVVIASHAQNDLALCDYIFEVRDGRIES
ncbi:ATP-binding cassette domain-containing protein [Lachnobacterium bovis]|uniref:ATP-binding cassette domain-containing protein n=1 Tax=Lachnobacterium bovis TaxID=140626 RepID=UPI00048D87CF|nr:ATP-binding cassette domain-containing protein [Lachnobacterium bovis]